MSDLNINVDLLRRVQKHINERPWEWDQGSFEVSIERWKEELVSFKDSPSDAAAYGLTSEMIDRAIETNDFTCDSAFCVAGWAAYFTVPDGVVVAEESVVFDEYSESITDYATRVLGLDHDAAYRLFSGGNTLVEVNRYIDNLVARHATALRRDAAAL